MIEITVHGRGGQGAVTSAELMAVAAISEGKFAQAFPSFGPERRGAPVKAFARINDKPIRTREKIYKSDILVVLDPSLPKIIDIASGVKAGGVIILNTPLSEKEARKLLKGYQGRLALLDATKIAIEVLGLPITNTTMLGAFLRVTNLIDEEAMQEALKQRFGKLAEKNINALKRAIKEVKIYE